MRMIYLFIVTGATLLTGCAGKTLNKNLPGLMYKPASYAVNVLGAPTRVSEYGSTRFLNWSVNQQGSMIMPTTNTSSTVGYIGSNMVYGTTTTYGSMVVPTSAVCSITLHERDDMIVNWEWQGNQYGCSQFASRIDGLVQ